MFFENGKKKVGFLESTVFHSAMKDKQMGVAIWDMKNGTFDVLEQMTNYSNETFESLPDFIQKVAVEKDQQLALSDLQDYLDEKQDMFRTTFRTESKDGEYRWLLLKGRIANNDRQGEQRFDILLHDVTGDNYLSGNDEETNLLNRVYFIHKLEHFYAENAGKQTSALMGMAISNFQSILDVYGYQTSIQMVRVVSNLIGQIIGQHNEVASFSKENYVALIYHAYDIKALEKRLFDTFKEPIMINGHQVLVEMNIGVTMSPEHSSDPMELLLFVETATHQAKQRGKYQSIYFDKTLSEKMRRRYLIKTELTRGLKEKEFYLLFQPQVDSKTGRLVGVEVLTRWENQRLGVVPPNVFIPIAENRGYMAELGHFILEESIKTASEWQKAGYDFGTMSINISPTELATVGYVDTVSDLCEQYGVDKSLLRLEITEGVYVETMQNSLETVHELVDAGFAIAVDDFGIGYSNLSFLSKAKINTLKIDKSIIDSIQDETGRVVVNTIVDLGNNLNYNVLAEGVESEEQVHLLAEMGCHLVQGYYYSKPITRTEMEAVFQNNYQV